MSNTFTTFFSELGSFFGTIAKKLETYMASADGQKVEAAVASVAGNATAYELIEQVNPTNKTQTANDIVAIGTVGVGLFSGTTPPTLSQTQAAFAALKSNAATTQFSTLANTLAADITLYLGTNNGSSVTVIAEAYIKGMIACAEAYGATAPTATPAS